jgi:hypothetical protein
MALSLPIRGRTLCACEPAGVSLPAATSYSITSSAQRQIVCLFMAPASSWSAFPEGSAAKKLFGGVLVQAGALLINHIAPRRRTLTPSA